MNKTVHKLITTYKNVNHEWVENTGCFLNNCSYKTIEHDKILYFIFKESYVNIYGMFLIGSDYTHFLVREYYWSDNKLI